MLSIVMVAASTLLRLQYLQGLGSNAPYITFYPAVVVAALYGGLRAGLLTLALSAVVAFYFWVGPVHTFTNMSSVDRLLLLTFLVTATIISIVAEAMHRARARAQAAGERELAANKQAEQIVREHNALLEQRVQERTEELQMERDKLTRLFETTPVGLIIANAQGGDLTMNPTALTLLDFGSVEEMHERVEEYANEWELRDTEGRQLPFDEWPLPAAIRGHYVQDKEFHFRCLKRDYQWTGLATTSAVKSSAGEVVLIVMTLIDITERKRAETLLNGQKQVVEMIAAGAPLTETLTVLIRLIEAQSPGMMGSILLLDADGIHVHHGAAPSMPAEFIAAVDGQPIGPAAGSCGTAAYRKEAVYVQDIATDPLWENYKAVALPLGLRACWSTPIFDAQQRAIGTFAMYYRKPQLPQPEHLKLIDIATHTAAIAISRKQAEQEISQLNTDLERRVTERTVELESVLATLRSQEQRYRLLVEGVKDVSNIMLDVNGRVSSWNSGAERLKGYTEAEIIGQHFSIFYPPEAVTAGKPDAELAQALDHGRAEDEGWRVRKDGSQFWASVLVTALYNDKGEVQGFSKITRDITERKQAQDQLRDVATRIQTILDAAMEGIITIDERGIVETVNPAAEHLFGYAAAEVVGQNVSMLMPEPYRHEHDGYLEHYCSTGEARVIGLSREVEGQRKDGGTFPLFLGVSEMWLHDQRHFIGMVRDITERKQYEKNLVVAKEHAELANRAKDSFLATMSHEIRTPLTGMLGMLEILSLTPLDREQDETLKAVWDSSRSLLRIVNDILDWSKIEEGKLALDPQATSIPQLLQEVVNTYSRVASAKSLTLWQHADARLSAAHIVDPLRLSQVLNNFVSNALKFTRRGEVEVRAELLEQVESGERIRFSVRDTGIGIAPDVQQRVFRRYQQGGGDTSRLYGGTGLGLSICRRLADLMDGQIELVSEPGQGSTFSLILTLPVSAAPGETVPSLPREVEQRAVSPLGNGAADAPLVLAVDDHPINRDLLARQLRLLGLRAETAEDGRVALSLWREGRFALVITDCHMPEMDGHALTQAIRKIEAEERLPRTPIIAWTANALGDERDRCRSAGMDDLLVKPTDMAQLKKMLAKWLSIAETDSSQPATSSHAADSGEVAGPIDYAELGKAVPDHAAQIKVLHDFQAHINADRAKLNGELEQGDPVKVERTAHRMKGSCRMVGAKEMANACAAIEQAARGGKLDDARAAMSSLEVAIQRFESYLTTLKNDSV